MRSILIEKPYKFIPPIRAKWPQRWLLKFGAFKWRVFASTINHHNNRPSTLNLIIWIRTSISSSTF